MVEDSAYGDAERGLTVVAAVAVLMRVVLAEPQ